MCVCVVITYMWPAGCTDNRLVYQRQSQCTAFRAIYMYSPYKQAIVIIIKTSFISVDKWIIIEELRTTIELKGLLGSVGLTNGKVCILDQTISLV